MSLSFDDLFADWSTLTYELKVDKLLQIETLLNSRSGHRYHFRQLDTHKFGIYEILHKDKAISVQVEKVWIENLNIDQMFIWLNQHIIVRIEDKKHE